MENPEVAYSILCNLARDDNADVRYALAEKPLLPLSILSFLCEDENPYVAWRAYLTTQNLRRERDKQPENETY